MTRFGVCSGKKNIEFFPEFCVAFEAELVAAGFCRDRMLFQIFLLTSDGFPIINSRMELSGFDAN